VCSRMTTWGRPKLFLIGFASARSSTTAPDRGDGVRVSEDCIGLAPAEGDFGFLY